MVSNANAHSNPEPNSKCQPEPHTFGLTFPHSIRFAHADSYGRGRNWIESDPDAGFR